MRNEESDKRVKLAGRILMRMRCGAGPPILPSEIAHLRFLAESEEELAMSVEQLVVSVLDREHRRMGIPSWPPDGRFMDRN